MQIYNKIVPIDEHPQDSGSPKALSPTNQQAIELRFPGQQRITEEVKRGALKKHSGL
jgi:hypothetical protein